MPEDKKVPKETTLNAKVYVQEKKNLSKIKGEIKRFSENLPGRPAQREMLKDIFQDKG